MQNAVLYQAHGTMGHIYECRFSLLKFLATYNLMPPAQTGIIIYTDQPQYFEMFAPYFRHFVIQAVSKDQLREWRGSMDFVHRVKIEIIRDFFSRYDANLLYCDCDTYITSPVEDIFRDMHKGIFFMHEYEGLMDKKKHPEFEKWIRFLSTTPLHYNGKKFAFSIQQRVWNAGVIGINGRSNNILTDVLSLSDSLYAKFPKHIAEQLAFSFCLQKEGYVKSSSDIIAHYWNLKEFRNFLGNFFSAYEEESVPNLVKLAERVDPLSIQQDKVAYMRLPVHQKLLKKLTGKAWKIQNYQKNI